jgi:hypothetical protein
MFHFVPIFADKNEGGELKKSVIFVFVILFFVTALLHQNCTGELDPKSKQSASLGALDLQFKYSQMYVTAGSQVLALDGTCSATGYPRNRINWATVIGGRSVTGSLDNVCNNTTHRFAMNINLAPYSLPLGTKFNITGNMVGIDKVGKLKVGGAELVKIEMVGAGQATGTTTGSGSTSGGNSGLDGEPTGTSTGGEPPPPPPDICTPGPSQLIEDLHEAMSIEPNGYIADWPVTSTITDVTMDGSGGICIYHTKLGVWPAVDTFGLGELTTEGNYWFVVGIGDSFWFVFPFHWYRPGQACKNISMTNTGLESGVGGATTPLTYWTPCSGSIVGVVASTPGRTGPMGPIQERSDIFWMRWP